MPNQTLYDNFSQVRQYIDQEKPDLSSYVTKTELAACSYVTSSDLPVINENIVPKENNTYTLGDVDHLYNATYSTNFYAVNVSYTSGKTSIKMNDRNIDIWTNNKKLINVSDYGGVIPIKTNFNLGTSSNKWDATYTTNLYADNIHNLIWTGTSAEYAALSNYTTYQLYLIKNE